MLMRSPENPQNDAARCLVWAHRCHRLALATELPYVAAAFRRYGLEWAQEGKWFRNSAAPTLGEVDRQFEEAFPCE